MNQLTLKTCSVVPRQGSLLFVFLFLFFFKMSSISMLGETIAPKRHLLGNNGLVKFGPEVDLEKGTNSVYMPQAQDF